MFLLTLLACRNKDGPTDTGPSTDPDACDATWYEDADGDGFGSDATAVQGCHPGSGWVEHGGDCDDASAAVGPLMAEICDALDNDCDGSIDNDAVDGATFYADADGDGYGDAEQTFLACRAPEGHVSDATDCDDDDPGVHPGASDGCDGDDNDCDGLVDEDPPDGMTWYYDADGDGEGGQALWTEACEAPQGFVGTNEDCDDLDAEVHPLADETCDGRDEDCDGDVDESPVDATAWYADADGDGHGDANDAGTEACEAPSGAVSDATDCDDGDPQVQQYSYYADSDGDGYGDAGSETLACSAPSGTVEDATDCDDGEATAYPGSHETETPGDGVDTDCDGYDGCDDLNCDGWPDLLLPGLYDDAFDDAPTYVYYGSSTGYGVGDRLELAGDGIRAALAQDLDHDGYVDIVLGAYRDDDGYETDSTVYWGSASGHGPSDADSLTGYGTLALCAEDLDNDGYDEVLLGAYYDGDHTTTSTLYWGSSNGYSSTDTSEFTTYGVRDCAIEDMDGDGTSDLVLGSYAAGNSSYNSTAYIVWGDVSASYSTSTAFSTHRTAKLTVADVDLDGQPDLVLPRYKDSENDFGTNSPVWYGPSFTDWDSISGEGTWEIEVADLDQDGHQDLVTCSYAEAPNDFATTSAVWWGSTAGYSAGNTTALPTWGCRDVDIADVDGDGWDDVLFANFRDTYTSFDPGSRVYYGSATGFDSSDYDLLPGSYTYKLNQADLDGDGYLEILVGNYYDGSSYEIDSFIYWGSATGYSTSDRTDLPGAGVWGEILVVGSLD